MQLDFHKHYTEYAFFSRRILGHVISCEAWFCKEQGSNAAAAAALNVTPRPADPVRMHSQILVA